MFILVLKFKQILFKEVLTCQTYIYIFQQTQILRLYRGNTLVPELALFFTTDDKKDIQNA